MLVEYDIYQFQSHNGLILIQLNYKKQVKVGTFQSHNGLILIGSMLYPSVTYGTISIP